MMQAVFISRVVWFARCPECDIPGRAVCPLPNPLLINVVASNPGIRQACSVHPLHDKVSDGVRGDGSQMSALLLAEVLSIVPIFLIGAPEVAVVAVLLPALFAGFDAIVIAAFFGSCSCNSATSCS